MSHSWGTSFSPPPRPSLFPAILPCRLDKRSLRSENLHHLRLLLHIYISVRTYYACVPHRWCLSPGNFILHCDTSHPDFCVILMYLQRLSSMNWNDFCEWLQEIVYKVRFYTLNVVQNMRKWLARLSDLKTNCWINMTAFCVMAPLKRRSTSTQTTLRYLLQGYHLHTRRNENLKSYKFLSTLHLSAVTGPWMHRSSFMKSRLSKYEILKDWLW